MKLDLSKETSKARDRLETLIEKGAVIELREIKGRRTIDQNSLYWIWLTVIEVETGNEKEHSHLLYRAKFLRFSDEYVTGFIRPDVWEKVKKHVDNFHYFEGLDMIIDAISHSTTALDTAQFTAYLESIRDHASKNMGLHLVTLEEKGFEDFYNNYERAYLKG